MHCIGVNHLDAALHLVRCEVEKAESLPHLASHCQLGPLTQLLEIFLRNLRKTESYHLEPRKMNMG